MRIIVVTVIAIHAVAHVPGFIAFWPVAALDALPYRTAFFGGRVDVGELWTRVIGGLWLATAITLAVAAGALATHASWARELTAAAMILSFGLCVSGWPDAHVGVLANAVIATVLLLWKA